MACNLPDLRVESVLDELPDEFSTLHFIEKCPYSGGSDDGKKCATVTSESRASCGKRLGSYARGHPRRLAQTNPGKSPARWKDNGPQPFFPK